MPDPFDCYLSSPVVWNGAVYFGSGDGNVYAVDAGSGALKWKFKTGDVVHASPAIADGKVYIGSWDSYFYALDAATGKEVWRFKTGEDPDIHNQVGIQSSAAVVDGVVYFGCRDSHLYALDAKTGEKKWAYRDQGLVGDCVSGGARWEGVLRDLRFGPGVCAGCKDRRRDFLAESSALAVILFAGDCGRRAVRRFEFGPAECG